MRDDEYSFLYDGTRRHSFFDPLYPLRIKQVNEPGHSIPIEPDNSRTGNLTGEVELIARTAYRLGHAEERADNAVAAMRSESNRADDFEKKNEGLRIDLADQKSRYARLDKADDEKLVKIKRLENRIKRLTPKKEGKK